MKSYILIALAVALTTASCSRYTCYPTKKSDMYANDKHRWKVDSVHPDDKGSGWIVSAHRFEDRTRISKDFYSPCQPADSIQAGNYVTL